MATTTAGERVLPPPSQRVVPIMEAIARAAGQPLHHTMRVLDFGAGAGRHVAEFLDAGYDTLGVDQIHTSHADGSVEPEYLRQVHPPDYVLPFDDGTFDFVYSTSVMEHVMNPGGALAEVARVLRPGGLSIHAFPSRWRPLEPHMYVPLGGRFNSFATMRLWAALGIRNGFQKGLPAGDTALANTQYARTGICYPSTAEWRQLAQRSFARAGWYEPAYVRATASVSRVSRLAAPVIGMPGMARLYRGLHTRVLVLWR